MVPPKPESSDTPLPNVSSHDRSPESLALEPNITKYMGSFTIQANSMSLEAREQSNRFEDSIFVFKKKRLPHELLKNNLDIYKSSYDDLELDRSNRNKSRISCQRCRRYKNKCTRDLPECLSCTTCDELCIYKPRKRKLQSLAIESGTKKRRHDSSGSPTDHHEPKRSLSESNDDSNQGYDSRSSKSGRDEKQSSDIMRLLN